MDSGASEQETFRLLSFLIFPSRARMEEHCARGVSFFNTLFLESGFGATSIKGFCLDLLFLGEELASVRIGLGSS